MDIIITIVILLFSAIIHEIMHGLVAEKMGDSTARDAGRITLNPISHIDPFGSILLPTLMYLTSLPLISAGTISHPILLAFAKPVPVNFARLQPQRLGMALVSLAGPLSNFILAIIFILPYRFGIVTGVVGEYWLQASLINIVLGTFNLLPIPPLDGSKIVASFLPYSLMNKLLDLERFGFILVVIFMALGLLDKILYPVVYLFMKIFGLVI